MDLLNYNFQTGMFPRKPKLLLLISLPRSVPRGGPSVRLVMLGASTVTHPLTQEGRPVAQTVTDNLGGAAADAKCTPLSATE